MNLHRWPDVVGQKRMWRYPRPPVESTTADIKRLARLGDELPCGELRTVEPPNASDMHPPVKAPALVPRRPGNVVDPTGPGRKARRKGIFEEYFEEHFTFPSPYRTGLRRAQSSRERALDTVHVVGWRPWARRTILSDTALVMVHGAYAPDHRRIRWFVPPVGRAPWDTYSLELPHHMRRQRSDSTYSGSFFVSADVGRLVRGMHQGETDVRALVRGLRALGYRRIVLGGISIGGNIVFESTLRERVDGAFALAPSMDAYASLWESVLGKCIRAAGNAAGITDGMARRALALVTPRHMGRPVVGGGRLLVIYGENDLLCPPGPVRELREAWGIRHERVLETGHATLVLRYWTVRRTIAAWMKHSAGGSP